MMSENPSFRQIISNYYSSVDLSELTDDMQIGLDIISGHKEIDRTLEG